MKKIDNARILALIICFLLVATSFTVTSALDADSKDNVFVLSVKEQLYEEPSFEGESSPEEELFVQEEPPIEEEKPAEDKPFKGKKSQSPAEKEEPVEVGLLAPDEVWVDDEYYEGGYNEGHTWSYDAFDNIQDGLDAVADGGIVYVHEGEYYGPIYIRREISLLGDDKTSTIIHPGALSPSDRPAVVNIFSTKNVLISEFTINGPYYVIYIRSSSLIRIQNCIIKGLVPHYEAAYTHRSAGVYIVMSELVEILDNHILCHTHGIHLLEGTTNSLIKDNIIENNEGTPLPTVTNVADTILHGGGIKLDEDTKNNMVYHNNFINNGGHAYDLGVNQWDDGYPSGGNHWDDYTGPDEKYGPAQNLSGSDGIGDIPYRIPGRVPPSYVGNVDPHQDQYPFIQPNGWLLNDPPFTPHNPNPADASTDVLSTIDLTWEGGDPNPQDTVTYDVYFGQTSSPPKVKDNQSELTYEPGSLTQGTTYYWTIISRDNHGASTKGPLWFFTTEQESLGGGSSSGGSQSSRNRGPIADASAGEPYYGFIGEAISFDGSRSYDPDGHITSWLWNFGDDNHSEGEVITHIYENPGRYQVKLTVTDNKGAESSYLTQVVVSQPNRPPSNPEFYGELMVHMNYHYLYTIIAYDEDGDLLQYTINWGDGTTDISSFIAQGIPLIVGHIWDSPGTYDVIVSVSDNQTVSESTYSAIVEEKGLLRENVLVIGIALMAIIVLFLIAMLVIWRQK